MPVGERTPVTWPARTYSSHSNNRIEAILDPVDALPPARTHNSHSNNRIETTPNPVNGITANQDTQQPFQQQNRNDPQPRQRHHRQPRHTTAIPTTESKRPPTPSTASPPTKTHNSHSNNRIETTPNPVNGITANQDTQQPFQQQNRNDPQPRQRHHRRTPPNPKHGPQPQIGGPYPTAALGNVPAPARYQGRESRDRVRAGGPPQHVAGLQPLPPPQTQAGTPAERARLCVRQLRTADRPRRQRCDQRAGESLRQRGTQGRGLQPSMRPAHPPPHTGEARRPTAPRRTSQRPTRSPRPTQGVRRRHWPAADASHSMPRTQYAQAAT